MNIEQTCKDAIAVVQRYLDSDVVEYYVDIFDELCEAQDAVYVAWYESNSHKSTRIRLTAWHACEAAKDDEWVIAKVYVDEFWGLV